MVEGFATLALKGLLPSVDHIVADQDCTPTKRFPHSLHSDGFLPRMSLSVPHDVGPVFEDLATLRAPSYEFFPLWVM